MKDEQVAVLVYPALQEPTMGDAVAFEADRVASARPRPNQDKSIRLIELPRHPKEEIVGQAIHMAELKRAGEGEAPSRLGPREHPPRPDEGRLAIHARRRVRRQATVRLDAVPVTDDLDLKNYYFRVSSVASDGYQGEWSDTLTFITQLPPPVPPPSSTPGPL